MHVGAMLKANVTNATIFMTTENNRFLPIFSFSLLHVLVSTKDMKSVLNRFLFHKFSPQSPKQR